MRTVFISYRREDTAGEARALFKDLVTILGKDSVFMDVDTINLGQDFREAMHERLESCDVMLVLIGNKWLDTKSVSSKHRLDEPNDFVRQEITTALKRNILVAPILLQGARIPTANELPEELECLTYRNGFELRHDRWESDVHELVSRLGLVVGKSPAMRHAAPESKNRNWPAIGGILTGILATVFGGYQSFQSSQKDTQDPVNKSLLASPPTLLTANADGLRKDRVEAAARRGFEALLERNAQQALAAFDDAYAIWDVYQSIDEIRQLLRAQQSELTNRDSAAWPQFYKVMIDKNFQLPNDLREQFKAAAK